MPQPLYELTGSWDFSRVLVGPKKIGQGTILSKEILRVENFS
jgi:hypothetical protein